MGKSGKKFDNDLFAKELGIVITEIDEGTAAAKLTITEKMLNGVGIANGGVLFTLVDFTLALAANSSGDDTFLTMNVNINYCKPALLGSVITARAACLARSGKSISCNIIASDESGEVFAVAHGTAYKTKTKD